MEKVLRFLPGKPGFLKLLAGATLIALIISLVIIYILDMLNFHVNTAVALSYGVIGAALYALKIKQKYNSYNKK